jgi:RNA polymerase sigma factor (sigma-70 family)
MKKVPITTTETLSLEREAHLSETFRKEQKRLLSFIRRRVPQPDEAEDILQDVFEQLAVSFDVLKPIEQMTAWLFRVTRNKIIDRYRKKKPDSLEEISLRYSNEEDAPVLFEWLSDPQNTPETDFQRNLIWEALWEALGELPEEQREVFVWHELEDKSFKEMSEITGVSVNTLLSRKRYAVLALQKKLQTIYND